MKIKVQILIYLLLLYIPVVSAESYEFTHRYSARAMGMANIFCPVASDSTAVFYNPAGLSQIEESIFNSMYADIHGLGIATDYILSAGNRYNDDIGLAGAWVYERVDLDPEVWHQHRFFYGISYAILEGTYIGIAPKLIYIDTGFKNYEKVWGYAFDAGFLVTSENWGVGFFDNNDMVLRIGATFKNIYSLVKWSKNYKEKRFLNLIWYGINVDYKQSLSFLFQVKSVKTSIIATSTGLEFFLFNAFSDLKTAFP